jgi:hypothetical protein
MDFKIEFPIKAPDSLLRIESSYFFAGSCFAENMASKMQDLMLNQEFLYHGILFNPISLCKAFQQILNNEIPNDSQILESNGIYLSWNHHGSVYKKDKQELIKLISEKNKKQNQSLKDANCLVISFGSAFVYELIETNHIVANCHKIPAKLFRKRLLNINEIVSNWKNCIHQILQLNPNLKILLTVSPVKYLKDGIHENNLSKSTLLLAVNELCKIENCIYFPAFEIIQDELRDYRFYGNDMAHPSEQAIQYVWEKFIQYYFDQNSKEVIKELNQFFMLKNHRILHEGTSEHQQFIKKLSEKEKEIQKKYPFLNL